MGRDKINLLINRKNTMIYLLLYLGIMSTKVQIGNEALIEDNLSAHFSRFVNLRPGNGETVHLNPPRFSWFSCPRAEERLKQGKSLTVNHIFTLQISDNSDLENPVVDVTNSTMSYVKICDVVRTHDMVMLTIR